MSWIDKILPAGIGKSAGERVNVPEGLWHKCVKCEAVCIVLISNNHMSAQNVIII